AAAERPRWMRNLSLLPTAPISTIHGFCGILLREHGLDAGIDPSFSILDEQQSLDLSRESAVDAIRQEIRSGNAAVERVFGDFGLDVLVESIVKTAYCINSLGKDPTWLIERAGDQEQAAKQLETQLAADIAKYGGDFEKIGLFGDELDARRAKHPLRKRD